ncbi:hypothetical protein [Clostridium hydrogeniformans]|uniref:hypothetical protein n=1 Tax=Clostridium hydrogeniformans TaxID=349933 RepID=UPI0012378BDB|nr:hypothetical protein [Clostridium hydrogeniformans]
MKSLKKIGVLTLALVIIIFGVVACNKPKESSEKSEVTVKNFFENVKRERYEDALKEVRDEDKERAKESINSINTEDAKEIGKELYKNLDYKIISEDVNGDNAKVKTEVTLPNTLEIITRAVKDTTGENIQNFITNKGNLNSTNYTTIRNNVMEELKKPDVTRKTKNYDLDLVKVNGKWKMVGNDELMNALSGDLYRYQGLYK